MRAPLDQAPSGFRRRLSEFLTAIHDNRPLGIAVSGGSDSLGLLYGLASLAAPGRLVGLTVDHGLRAGSADEARRVKAHCRRLGLRHETFQWTGPYPGSGLQASARAARYRLLGGAAARLGLAAVITAHTADDQRETLEMRRTRSPSDDAAGLAGIPPATLFDGRLWALRPLLDIAREEIRDFLASAGVDWIEDPSNSDHRFERVRVRASLRDPEAVRSGPDHVSVGEGRMRLARAAAGLIEARCVLDKDQRVRLRYEPKDDPDALAAAMEALIDLIGGSARPLDRRGKATLLDAVQRWTGDPSQGDGGAFTLGRALVQWRRCEVAIRRERRGVEELSLDPGARQVWDGRYLVANLDAKSLLCVGDAGTIGVLPWFSRHSAGTSTGWSAGDGVIGGFECTRLIGRCSRILPVYELPLAQALARLAGVGAFPECPWNFLAGSRVAAAANLR